MITKDKPQIRIVFLCDGAHLDSVVIRLHKGWIVRFMKGENLLGRDVRVVTSINGEVSWNGDADDLAAYAEIVCTRAGAFSYSFYVNNDDSKKAGSGYLQVIPELAAAKKPLPLDAVVCQTHLSKLLGPLPEWESRLLVAKNSGYNMIHFTPIQALGISNSSYSIANPLELNPSFNTSTKTFTLDDVQSLTNKLENDWGVLSIQDVVWNHAAKNAPWLLAHPECGYNCKNSPHLRPAYIVDRLLYHFSKEISAGDWANRGIPQIIENEAHLAALRHILKTEVYPKVRLHEFFQVDVNDACKRFSELVKRGATANPKDEFLDAEVGAEWRRFGFTVDFEKAFCIFNRTRGDAWNEDDRQMKCLDSFRQHIIYLNNKAVQTAEEIIDCGVNAIIGHVRYERVDPSGPRRKELTDVFPLVTSYFLHALPSTSWEDDEKYAYSDAGESLLAFNGWVMNDDPLRNFALYPSQVYLRRELVCWGDCVKLRYGEKPEDCPFLWELMTKYSQSCARIFHGVRIDNCHSTPIHVAEYLLKAAREVRPDLYVVAELFTGREDIDNIFVNRLGITSLIREAQNGFDSHEQGRFVYRYGGDVVGAFIQKTVQAATPCVAHALFYDQTHDNPSGIEKRSVYDILPTAGMVAMASCANGSTRGYDELIPYALSVVSEKRLYRKWSELGEDDGIIAARKAINNLHVSLAQNGYTQVFVDQMNFDIVAVTRHNPVSHETVILVAHTAFVKDSICMGRPPVRDVFFKGRLDEIIFEACLHEIPGVEHRINKTSLSGITGYKVMLREHIKPNESELVVVHGVEDGHIELSHFPSSSIIALKVSPRENVVANITKIRNILDGKEEELDKELNLCLEKMTLQSYNRVLFRCEQEDLNDFGIGTYNIPNFGNLVYCGFEGLMPLLKQIRLNNDLGHPLCCNIRDGRWLCDYITYRLKVFNGTKKLGSIVEKFFEPLHGLQHYLKPCYFEAILHYIYVSILHHLDKKLNPSLMKGSAFARALALSSVSFSGSVKSALLPSISPKIEHEDQIISSLSAGLPHFTVGIWRNWGRDTFIALPGCLLITGRYNDARRLILSYAGVLRHGLIPNLLAEGKGARYNCRDAVWFWLYAIIQYIKMAPNGKSILQDEVLRHYPDDNSEFGKDEKIEKLCDTMYEAFVRHFKGIKFRERNAGHQIDEQMQDEGFNVQAYVDRETGFICGGNSFNCGTWMDKMGSSSIAGNRGLPATPRDGAAVELQGLAYAVICELDELYKNNDFPHSEITDGNTTWKWSDWSKKMKDNFEAKFFVDDNDHNPNVNRRSIVKDSFGSSSGYTDYQLRPNFAITLAVAPTIMNPQKSWAALNVAEEALMGPLGIKTLDPKDWAYNGFYNNSDDSTNKSTARGWNYHQGPEWVWVAGYFLRAKLVIAKHLNDPAILDQTVRSVRAKMGTYWEHLRKSNWISLPELTNENGTYCHDSCEAQAWSIGCLLETVNQLYNYN